MTKTATGVNVSGGADIDQATAPSGGAGLRMGKRTIRIVGAGDNNAWKGEALSGQRSKAGCFGREIGAFRIGNGDQQGGLDRRVWPRGPMRNGKAG